MLFAPDGLSIFSTVVWNIGVLAGIVMLQFWMLYAVKCLENRAKNIEQLLWRVVLAAGILFGLCALGVWMDLILF